jgi:H+-transporting ATPase
VPGDLVELKIGDIIPADCIVIGDPVQVDQSALTGESLPVTIYTQGKAKMGSVIKRGESHGIVSGIGILAIFLTGVQG